ncbi:hypothetical protein [Mycobacterium sp. HUMS_1102779]|uniref:hypothetical protein n=1 Tax=Mycobacterium sp. HUMS_1102779 TaxID=3383487 RepID=UPI003899D4FC
MADTPERVGATGMTPEESAAAAAAADYRQAEYFLGLLMQRRLLIDHRVEQYRKAVVAAESGGDAERAYGLRRMAHAEEQDRRTLEDLTQNLQRRFPRQDPGGVPGGAQARFAVR